MDQLSHLYMTTGKIVALTTWTLLAKWCLYFLIRYRDLSELSFQGGVPSYKGITHTHPHLPKAPSPNTITSGLGLQHMNLHGYKHWIHSKPVSFPSQSLSFLIHTMGVIWTPASQDCSEEYPDWALQLPAHSDHLANGGAFWSLACTLTPDIYQLWRRKSSLVNVLFVHDLSLQLEIKLQNFLKTRRWPAENKQWLMLVMTQI